MNLTPAGVANLGGPGGGWFGETPTESGQIAAVYIIFGAVCFALQLLFFLILAFLVVRFLWNRGGPPRP